MRNVVSVGQQTLKRELSDEHQIVGEIGSECYELLLGHIGFAVCSQGLFREETHVLGSKHCWLPTDMGQSHYPV